MSTTIESELRLLLTPAEAAKALGISIRTLDQLVAEDRLPAVRLRPGGNRRFRRSDLMRLAQETKEER